MLETVRNSRRWTPEGSISLQAQPQRTSRRRAQRYRKPPGPSRVLLYLSGSSRAQKRRISIGDYITEPPDSRGDSEKHFAGPRKVFLHPQRGVQSCNATTEGFGFGSSSCTSKCTLRIGKHGEHGKHGKGVAREVISLRRRKLLQF